MLNKLNQHISHTAIWWSCEDKEWPLSRVTFPTSSRIPTLYIGYALSKGWVLWRAVLTRCPQMKVCDLFLPFCGATTPHGLSDSFTLCSWHRDKVRQSKNELQHALCILPLLRYGVLVYPNSHKRKKKGPKIYVNLPSLPGAFTQWSVDICILI